VESDEEAAQVLGRVGIKLFPLPLVMGNGLAKDLGSPTELPVGRKGAKGHKAPIMP
jgi:hypothetical protein